MEKYLATYLGKFVFKNEVAYTKYLELLEEAKTNPLAYKELIEILLLWVFRLAGFSNSRRGS